MDRINALLLASSLALLCGCGEDPTRHRYAEHWGEDADGCGEPQENQGEPWDGFCGRDSQERECDIVGSCRMASRLRECYLTEQVGNEHVCRYENPEHYLDGSPCITVAECVAGWSATGRSAEEVATLCDPDFVWVPIAAYPD